MKWYSIKQHIPPARQEMFLRAWNKENKFDRYFIARIYYLENIDLLANWEMANEALHDITIEDYIVTHFCIIDIVEYEK